MEQQTRILIIGGGFGGISAALALEKKHLGDVKITLVSDKPHFEYHPALYRIATGRSPLEVCIPLREIFEGKNVEVVQDEIIAVDLALRTAQGVTGSHHAFDYLVLALGSETAYFDIPGLKEFSFGFKSITDALKLKRHLHEMFAASSVSPNDREENRIRMHFVVVGAGATGVELAGELAVYTKILAARHGSENSLVEIDLIDAAPRILPGFSAVVSQKIAARLRALGVTILTDRPMVKEEMERVMVRGMSVKTETVIWTAGVKPHARYQKIVGLLFDKKGRVLTDKFLQAQGQKKVFVIGDGAATLYSGTAQAAIHNGKLAAENIVRLIGGKPLALYVPKRPYHSLPIGPKWAVTIVGPLVFYGAAGWLLRRAADFRYFFSILPLRKAITAFRSGKTLCEACEICSVDS